MTKNNKIAKPAAKYFIPEDLRLFKAMVDSSSDSMSIISKDRYYALVNDAYCRNYGFKKSKVIGHHADKVWAHTENFSRIHDNLDRCLAGKKVEDATWLTLGNGKRAFIDVVYHPFRDKAGNVTHAVIVSRDITKYKEAEEKLAENEEKFRALSEQSLMAILVLQDDRIVYANDAASKICELSIPQLLALDTNRFLDLIHPKDRKVMMKRIKSKLASTGRSNISAKEYRLIVAKDRLKWLNLYSNKINYQSRPALLVSGIDITELKAARNQILQQVVQDKLHRLVGEFIGEFSHDFKTPISVVKNSLFILNQNRQTAKCREELEVIDRQIDRLDMMIRNILTFSQLEQGAALTLQKQSLNPILDSTLQAIGPAVLNKKQKLSVNIPTKLPRIAVSPDQLSRAIYNLLDNASKYSRSGKTITLSVTTTRQEVSIIVSDQGSGIAPKDLPHLFERYHKISLENKNGTGLGLAIVKKIVEAHQGRVEVTSKKGQGSTFCIILPREA